jgi:HEAT repeat protein
VIRDDDHEEHQGCAHNDGAPRIDAPSGLEEGVRRLVGNESTLPEDVVASLVRASARDDDAARDAVRSHLDDEHPRVRVLALRAGSRHGWVSEVQWDAALKDTAADVRREAATLLASATASDVLIDALIWALGDDDPLVVDATAYALGERRWRAAVNPLIDVATTHIDARCRESAVAALGAIGDDRARQTIIDALTDKATVRRRAVVALTNFEGPDIEAALERAREDRDWQVRSAIDQLDRGPLSDS